MRPEAFFSGTATDRADLLRAAPERLAELSARPCSRELLWRDGLPAIDRSGRLEWGPLSGEGIFLGLERGEARFSPYATDFAEGFPAVASLGMLSPAEAPLFAAALSLARWHAGHGFCANCGRPSDRVRGGWSRRCSGCQCEHFPRVDPVVIVLVEHDDSLLLGRQPHYPPGRYSALAGFVEVGESIENAVARELKEETGIDVERIEYVCSQPWPFPSSLMIGCSAFALARELVIDRTELADASWFDRADIAAAMSDDPDAPFQAPPPAAIARTLMEHWLALDEAPTPP